MHLLTTTAALLLGLTSPIAHVAAQTPPVWETLPPTPKLPGEPVGTTSTINGVEIWHAEFGDAANPAILMLHGGFGNSDYWGAVIEILQASYHIIAMDTRGHGRSTLGSQALSYELYASDAAALLSALSLPSAAWVGWSDMGAGTLAALQDAALTPLISRAFVFGGFHSVSSTNTSFTSSPTYKLFSERVQAEYEALQPAASRDWAAFSAAVTELQTTQPEWTEADIARITLGAGVTIAAGQYEEAVNLDEPALLNGWIKDSKLVTLADVSHFAPVQDAVQFAAKVDEFMKA